MKTADSLSAARHFPPLRYRHTTARSRRSTWRRCEHLLEHPIPRALAAAWALHGLWTGQFQHDAAALHAATGLPALLFSGLLQGAIAGHLVTGDWRGIGVGALSGAAFGLIGDVSSGWTGAARWFGRAALQGLAGGALALLEGRSWRDGLGAVVFADLAFCAGIAAFHWL